jgi:hypothetical protein
MFAKKRILKKDRKKISAEKILLFFAVIIFLIILTEYMILNFPIGSKKYLNPLALGNNSKYQLIIDRLSEKNIKFSNLKQIGNQSYKLILSDNSEVILSSKKDINAQLSSLQLILSRLTIEGKKLKVLDFRFDYPVISF